ncbi:MAG: mechanosensitive ion channel [Candidatus Binatia bacterium]
MRVLVALLAGGVPAWAQRTPSPQDTRTPPPATIAIADVAGDSEQIARELRAIGRRIGPSPAVDAVAARLPEARRRADDLELEMQRLASGPVSLNLIVDLSTQWQGLSAQLKAGQETLTRDATRWDKDYRRLTDLLRIWEGAAVQFRASGAPETLLARVDGTVASLREARARVASRRDQVLTLQDQVARELGRAQAALDTLDQTRLSAAWRAFVPDGPPIWSTMQPPLGWRSLLPSWGAALRDNHRQVVEYLTDRGADVAWQLAFSVVVFAALWHGRMRSRQWSLQDAARQRLQPIYALPVSATIVANMAMVWWTQPHAPRALHFGFALAALVPLVRIANCLTPPTLHPLVAAFAAFFVVDRLRETVSMDPRFAQLTLLLAIPLLGALTVSAARRLRLMTATPGAPRIAGVLRSIVLPVLIAAFVGNALGFIQIARGLYYGVFRSATAALPVWEVYWIAGALVADSLRSWPLDLLRMVRRYRPLFEGRCLRLLRWLLMGSWVYFTLRLLRADAAVWGMLQTLFTTTLSYREVHISLVDVLALGGAIWFSFALSRFVRFVLEEDVFPRLQLELGLPYALSALIHYLILFGGFLLALALVGIDLTRITILAGAVGVGIGFGLQGVINNFVSGLILLFERPIRVGDNMQLGEIAGEMRRIGLRSSTVRTWEGAEIIVPNAELTTRVVTNWTLSDRLRRIDVRVGVAYGTPPRQVLDLLLAVAGGHAMVVADPNPIALFVGFGDSSLDFELRAFTDRIERWALTRSELNLGVHDALVAAGISIPFPQRDVHLSGALAGPCDAPAAESKEALDGDSEGGATS